MASQKQTKAAAASLLVLALAAMAGCARDNPARPPAESIHVEGDEAKLDRALVRTQSEVEIARRLTLLDQSVAQLQDESWSQAELGRTELGARLRALLVERDEAWREHRLLPLVRGRVAGRMRRDLGERVARLERGAGELSRELREGSHRG